MDPNLIFTLLPVALLGGGFIYNRIKAAVDNNNQEEQDINTDLQPTQLSSRAVKPITEEQELPLAEVIRYLNDRRDDVPHWFCKGGTGSGKSTFIRLALAYRVARGENFVIMTGKRTSVFDDVPCIGRDVLSEGKWKVTYTDVQRICRELLKELDRRDHIPAKDRSFTTINIVMDDASLILSEVEEAFSLFRLVGLLGRELDMRLIIATGSTLVKELGLEGRSDLRDHFAIVTYNKTVEGRRDTMLRPRYDDQINLKFDSSRVPDLSKRSVIDSNRVWRPIRDRQDELEDLHSRWLNGADNYENHNPNRHENLETFSSATKPVSASASQRNGFRVSLSESETIRIAAMIARNENMTPVVKAMPGYRADRHAYFVEKYNEIKNVVEDIEV